MPTFAPTRTLSVAVGYEPDDDLASLDHAHTSGTLNLDYLHNGAHQIRQIEASDESYLAPQPSPTSSPEVSAEDAAPSASLTGRTAP